MSDAAPNPEPDLETPFDPETAIEPVDPAMPTSDQVPYQRFWSYGLIAVGIAVVSIFVLNIAIVFVGVALAYVGIPYGLVAFIITAVLHYRTARKAAPVFGVYSVFGSFPQIASLFLNATLAFLGLLMCTFFLPEFLTSGSTADNTPLGGTAIFVAICYAPTAGAFLVGNSIPLFFSRKNIAQEQYAIINKLPARRWIRVNQILAVLVYAIVVLFLTVFLVNN